MLKFICHTDYLQPEMDWNGIVSEPVQFKVGEVCLIKQYSDVQVWIGRFYENQTLPMFPTTRDIYKYFASLEECRDIKIDKILGFEPED